MAKGVPSEALHQIGILFDAGAVGRLTDRQLLDRFRQRDGAAAEHAFAILVERHGPMILRVCRRILRDEHAAHDAFQATFLVLVRKAVSLRAHESLGGWLHAVACRVAAAARGAASRRQVHERKAAETARSFTATGGWDDLAAVLHEEIGRLPDTFRTAVVLCDLEGLTQEQVAQRLGWPSGTVRSRLARGRGRLQARLIRRGIAPSAATVAALLAAEAAPAAVPAALTQATIDAATLAAAGRTIAGAVSATALSELVLRAMFMAKVKLLSVALLALAAGAGGTAVVAFQYPGSPSPVAQGPARADRGQDIPPAPGAPEATDPPQPPPRSPEEEIERQISLAQMHVKRATDRYVWSDRMFQKGYVSRKQLQADKSALKQAMEALERAVAKRSRRPPGKPTENKKAGEPRPGAANVVPRAPTRADLDRPWPRSLFDEADLAGLPGNTRLVTLDWMRAYALAMSLGRPDARVPERSPAGLVDREDPDAMKDHAVFTAARAEFLAGPDRDPQAGEGFHDPSGELLDLLRRRQQVENARWNIAGFENLVRAVRTMLVQQSRDLSQLELDEVQDALQEARLHLVDEQEHYRDQLDALKLRLGLVPNTPIVLDKKILAGFRDPFDELDQWCANPQRDMTDLPRIAASLPVLDDVEIDGRSVASIVNRPDQSPLEDLLSAGVRVARQNNKGNPDDARALERQDGPLELRIRRAIRRLLRTRVDYALEQRRFVLVTRRRDQAQERLLAPLSIAERGGEEAPKEGAELIAELMSAQEQMLENQDRLVALWTEYQKLRLSLLQDIGTLSVDDRESFLSQLTARRGESKP